MPEKILQNTEPHAAERAPWHKPEVHRLTVNFGTQYDPAQQPAKFGSGEDGGFYAYQA
jgi:hypothetical protein